MSASHSIWLWEKWVASTGNATHWRIEQQLVHRLPDDPRVSAEIRNFLTFAGIFGVFYKKEVCALFLVSAVSSESVGEAGYSGQEDVGLLQQQVAAEKWRRKPWAQPKRWQWGTAPKMGAKPKVPAEDKAEPEEWEWNQKVAAKSKKVQNKCAGCMTYNSFDPMSKWCDTSRGCRKKKEVGKTCKEDYECLSHICSETCQSQCGPDAPWCWYEKLGNEYKGICKNCMMYQFYNADAKWCDKTSGCQSKKSAGDDCTEDYECVSGFCQDSHCFDYVPHVITQDQMEEMDDEMGDEPPPEEGEEFEEEDEEPR
ncbi:RPS6KA5 [Symbiodinium natans]|uniref:RPS6KA5 protein n=1 Tax=Symbiodinium natans TaxID=878477 RepID=A0A812HP97_9DINO|nr:RPS6KA5 [Symbiodinium natans]